MNSIQDSSLRDQDKGSTSALSDCHRSVTSLIVSSDNDEDEEDLDLLARPSPPTPPSNRHLSNVTRVKRSESDGIVVAERPKGDKVPVRRCESTNDATKIVEEMGSAGS